MNQNYRFFVSNCWANTSTECDRVVSGCVSFILTQCDNTVPGQIGEIPVETTAAASSVVLLSKHHQVHCLMSAPQWKATHICLYLYSSTPIWGTPRKAAPREGGSQDVADREIKTSQKKWVPAAATTPSVRRGPSSGFNSRSSGRTCPPPPLPAPTHKPRASRCKQTQDELNDGFIGKK